MNSPNAKALVLNIWSNGKGSAPTVFLMRSEDIQMNVTSIRMVGGVPICYPCDEGARSLYIWHRVPCNNNYWVMVHFGLLGSKSDKRLCCQSIRQST
jgi:hypothetical protein